MFKLIDIIKGGGSNPKLNKFLNRYVISKKEKTNLIKEIKNSKGGSSSTNFPYKISYFKVNNAYWEDIAQLINGMYPMIASINVNGGEVEVHISDMDLITEVTKFKVISWDNIVQEEIVNLDRVLKELEGQIYENYIEEITQEEYNNLKNEL